MTMFVPDITPIVTTDVAKGRFTMNLICCPSSSLIASRHLHMDMNMDVILVIPIIYKQ